MKKIIDILSNGEGLTVEFKKSRDKVTSDVYPSICAFLNRNGGQVVLGVEDDGTITGIKEDALDQMKKDLVAELYIRKQSHYSENRIYPFVTLEDLRIDLIQRVRKLARGQRPDHPWAELDDMELLKSARLFHKDYQSGKQGFTLAAVLLFGHDDVILNILPHHKTDALLRVDDIDRYDDRDDIRTNLIESYDQIMGFMAKHLPDKFYLIGDQRVSLRDRIFREVTANCLIHREYLNPFPAKFIIEENRVYTENANKPHGHGLIDPANFTPFPKNPVIARVFKEMGRADELGSGVKNIFLFTKAYSGADPQLLEEDIFRIIIPLTEQVTEQVKRRHKVIEFCKIPRSTAEIMGHLGLKHREYFRSKILQPLLAEGRLALTMPDTPRSPKQRYYSGGPDKTGKKENESQQI